MKLVSTGRGTLKELLPNNAKANELEEYLAHCPFWVLTQRQVSDVELLLNGLMLPLERFMPRNQCK